MSQAQRLKDHLDKGESVTRLSALTHLGIFELSSRIGEIESDDYQITRKRITVNNRFGESTNVMKYTKA